MQLCILLIAEEGSRDVSSQCFTNVLHHWKVLWTPSNSGLHKLTDYCLIPMLKELRRRGPRQAWRRRLVFGGRVMQLGAHVAIALPLREGDLVWLARWTAELAKPGDWMGLGAPLVDGWRRMAGCALLTSADPSYHIQTCPPGRVPVWRPAKSIRTGTTVTTGLLAGYLRFSPAVFARSCCRFCVSSLLSCSTPILP